jgi:selenoprotein W-related protein
MAQELLSTFEQEVDEVTLKPNKEVSGTFKITCNQKLIWCRKIDGGFPDIKELKKRVRDFINPGKRTRASRPFLTILKFKSTDSYFLRL